VGIEIEVMMPQVRTVLKNVALPADGSKEMITAVIARQLRWTPISPDYLEFASDDWFTRKRLAVRFTVDRPDLTKIQIIYPEQFTREFNPSVPIFIETDGACSGNPGPGGWGAIIC
jgi:hypothetical protein